MSTLDGLYEHIIIRLSLIDDTLYLFPSDN